MLIPRFSIRWVLGVTTLVAFFLLIVRLAPLHVWAMSICVAVLVVGLLFATYVATFALAVLLTRITGLARPAPRPTSPFVTESLPPQIVPPRESEFV